MHAESFKKEHHTDHEQEGKGEHFNGRMAIDKAADGICCEKHHTDGNHHCGDHYLNALREPDCGDDRVKREDKVEDNNLHYTAEKRYFLDVIFIMKRSFEFVVNLECIILTRRLSYFKLLFKNSNVRSHTNCADAESYSGRSVSRNQ